MFDAVLAEAKPGVVPPAADGREVSDGVVAAEHCVVGAVGGVAPECRLRGSWSRTR